MSEIQVLETRIEHLANSMERIEDILVQMSDSINKLAVIEERQAIVTESIKRIYEKLDSIEERLRTLEIAEPMQSQTTEWVLHSIWAIVGAAISFLVVRILNRG